MKRILVGMNPDTIYETYPEAQAAADKIQADTGAIVSITEHPVRDAEIGTVSSGTMLDEDVIPALLDELSRIDHVALLKLAAEYVDDYGISPYNIATSTSESYDDVRQWLSEELFGTLDEYAPPLCYFGAHPGDGADYGFWPYEDAETAAADDPDEYTVVSHTGSKTFVNGTRVPNGYDHAEAPTPFVLEISDHGNLALYGPVGDDGTRPEIW